METPETAQTAQSTPPTQGPTSTMRARRERNTTPVTPDMAVSTARAKTRTPAVKPRSLEELDQLDAKKMTSAECVLYINALREVLLRQKAQGDELNQIAKSSFEQFRNADDTLKKISAQADADIALAKQIINTAAKSIALIGGQH